MDKPFRQSEQGIQVFDIKLERLNGFRSVLLNQTVTMVMMNIYPQRATNPKDIHLIIDKDIHIRNLESIRKMLSSKKVTIWAAWGALIEKRAFLIPCLVDIYDLSKKYNCSWVSIGEVSKKGHPHHPLYLNSSEKIKPFHMEKYIETISS